MKKRVTERAGQYDTHRCTKKKKEMRDRELRPLLLSFRHGDFAVGDDPLGVSRNALRPASSVFAAHAHIHTTVIPR